MSLSLHPIQPSSFFPDTRKEPTSVYDVIGLPDGSGARIAKDYTWQIIEWRGDKDTDWYGQFDTPAEALAYLQRVA